MNYDTHLFIEIIESIQGIRFLRQQISEDVIVRFYSGTHGDLVMIDASDDYLTQLTACSILTRLGVGYLIPSLFPPQEEAVAQKSSVYSQEEEE